MIYFWLLHPLLVYIFFSPAIKETPPSFIIMAIQGDIVDFYLYILNKETGELDIKKLEYMGGQLNEIEN